MKTTEIKIVRDCIALLSSMIRGGERHTDTSQKAVFDSLELLSIENTSSSRPPVSQQMIEEMAKDHLKKNGFIGTEIEVGLIKVGFNACLSMGAQTELPIKESWKQVMREWVDSNKASSFDFLKIKYPDGVIIKSQPEKQEEKNNIIKIVNQ